MFKIPLFYVLVSFFISCNAPQKDKSNKHQQIKNEARNYSEWVSKVNYINEPSEFYSFDVTFTKGDSTILFIVVSKEKEYCEPIYLKHLIIHKNKDEYIDIRFKHHYKISRVTKEYKDLDFAKVEEVFLFSNIIKKQSHEYNGIRLIEKEKIYDFLLNEFGWKSSASLTRRSLN